MGKKLPTNDIARCAHGGLRAPLCRPGRVLGALALALLLAGCAASGAASDKDQRHGFYGGISAGGAVP